MPARDGVVLEGLLDPAAGAQQLVFPAALLDAATPQALGRRQIFDLAEQLVDRFVAVRGYADALSLGEKRDDRLRRGRSEEHTSELQSLMRISYAVFCLKKKTKKQKHTTT